jgi:hypothetical protein
MAGFAMDEDENEWEALNQTNWRGLGLTDPIKSVEVCSPLVRCLAMFTFIYEGQMAPAASFFESKGPRKAAH